ASISARLRFATCSSAPPETNGTCDVQLNMFILIVNRDVSVTNRDDRRARFQAIAVIIEILRLFHSGDAKAVYLQYFTIFPYRISPPGIVVIGIAGSRLEP